MTALLQFLGVSMGSRFWNERHQVRFSPRRHRKNRPKTFKTEEGAKKWAHVQGITKYKLVNLRSSHASTQKIRVVKN